MLLANLSQAYYSTGTRQENEKYSLKLYTFEILKNYCLSTVNKNVNRPDESATKTASNIHEYKK